jgi:hypothetical protein
VSQIKPNYMKCIGCDADHRPRPNDNKHFSDEFHERSQGLKVAAVFPNTKPSSSYVHINMITAYTAMILRTRCKP